MKAQVELLYDFMFKWQHCPKKKKRNTGELIVVNVTGVTNDEWLCFAQFMSFMTFIVTVLERIVSEEDRDLQKMRRMHSDRNTERTSWIEKKEPPFSPAPRHSSVLIKIPHRKNT